MGKNTIVPNVRLQDTSGVVHPNAQILIRAFHANSSWGIEAENEGDEYEHTEGIEGMTYEVAYYPDPTTKAKGFPVMQLLDYADGAFSKVLVADATEPTIKQVLDSTLPKEQKAIAAVKAALLLRIR